MFLRRWHVLDSCCLLLHQIACPTARPWWRTLHCFPLLAAGFYEGAISIAEDTAAKLDGLLKGTAA